MKFSISLHLEKKKNRERKGEKNVLTGLDEQSKSTQADLAKVIKETLQHESERPNKLREEWAKNPAEPDWRKQVPTSSPFMRTCRLH